MKNFLFAILAAMLGINSYGQITTAFKFKTQSFELRDTLCPDNQTYKLFSTASDSKETRPGMPELPVSYNQFIMPDGYVIDSITYVEDDTSTIRLNNLLFPVQPAVPSCVGCPSQGFKTPDSTVYSSSQPYPISRTSIDGSGIWHTANILTIGIYPYQYFPLENKLYFAGRITITIHYHINNGAPALTKKMLVSEYDSFVNELQSMVENPNDVSLYLNGIQVINELPVLNDFPIYQYVVVAPESFIGSEPLNRFVEWKKKKGVNIGVISMNTITNSTNTKDTIGNVKYNNGLYIEDNAAKLRLYLAEISKLGGCKYILLLGDETKVPVRKYYATHGPYDDSEVITDKYYADFNSDYAVDNNPNWGEITTSLNNPIGDKVDLFPEAYVGRIPCSSIDQFSVWVDKIMSYELNPGDGDANYLKSFVMTMADGLQSVIGNSTYNNLNIFNPLTLFKEVPYYNSLNPTAPYGSDIISFFNTSPAGWWTWDNHGLPYLIVTMSHLDNGENYAGDPIISSINCYNASNGLLSLHNDKKFGIITSNCCYVAKFSTSDNMLDAAIFNSHGGAVAMAGNTDYGWYPTGQVKLGALTSIIKACHEGNNLTQTRFCSADWAWFINYSPYDYPIYETYLTHNFFGDPEMMYYTKVPERIDADLSSRHIDESVNNTYQVTIKNLPIGRHAIVCLYKPADGLYPEFQKTEEVTPINHQSIALFNLPANTLGTGKMYVTITSFDMMPFMDEILISPGCTKSSNAENISVNTVYPAGNPIFKDHDIIVNPGATLTIFGDVYFVSDAKICVKPGGKLIIDGGLVGASCENFWQGIEVWGNSTLPQTVVNQGFISVLNGGSINDAVCGVRTAKRNGMSTDPTSYGGIIRCNNSSFINNRCAIRIYPYNLGAYNATINETDFLTNDHYMINVAPLPSEMFSIDGISGLNINKCTFNNSAYLGEIANNVRGIGLYLTNCSVTVGSNTGTGSNFMNLTYGINGMSTGGVLKPDIRYCMFENNLCGIYLSEFTGAAINKNTFQTLQTDIAHSSSGLYLNGCSGYSVQENTFEGHYDGINTYETGIVINNSGTAPNEIYNNTFTGLQNGITSQDDNRGLVCKCNDYNNVKFDQSALVSGTPGSLGIAPLQGASGSVSSPAGNTFSPQHATWQIPESDLKNQGAGFQYFHHALNNTYRIIPEYYSSSISRQNTFQIYTKVLSCPSKLNGGGISNESSFAKLVQQQVLIDSLETGLDDLVDGGNTEETAADIVFSNPVEALDIYNDLLTKSPYLSDTVMTEAVTKEEVLSNPLLHDILVANPQSATSEGVLDQLDQRVVPMPEDLYIDILNGVNILAPLTGEKASIAALKTDNATLYYHLMNKYLADSSKYAADSLLYLLDVQNTAEAAYLEAFIQLNSGDFSAMNSTLSGITSEFDLSNEEQILHGYYQQFFALLQQMQTDTLPDFQADSLTIDQLLELLENAPEPVKSYSRNILIANDVIVYHEPYLYDDGLKSSSVKKKHHMGPPTKQVWLQAFPNPAKDYIIVRYKFANELSDTQEKAVLEIVTTTGQMIKCMNLHDEKGQVVVSTRTFIPGVYIIHINGINKKVETTKFTVVH